MEEDKVRIRLVFEDGRILSKNQKKQGLKRSWIVLNRKCHRTISEFSNHILGTFSLFEACPNGLSLSMDGFVLPYFESSCVLKDKDIICVERKKQALLEIVEEDSEENVYDAIEVYERPRGVRGEMLLANEEFQKETGGYKSESEEDEVEEEMEEVVPEKKKKSSKKRKASSKSESSKRKKCKLAAAEETPNVAVVTKSKGIKRKELQGTEDDEQNDDNVKSMTKTKTKSKKSSQKESKESNEICQALAETKKTPSRSARRKKAKRQWLREKTKLEKEELQQKQMVVAPSQKPALTIDNHVIENNHCEALGNQQSEEHGDDVGDKVVPVEVRPGHIRFKSLDETDEAPLESEPPTETFLWNGNMTKKKGQKWGTEKTGFAKRYSQDLNEDTYQTQPAEAQPAETQLAEVETLANGPTDYEQLVTYTGPPKKGDVIAYRLIELTSSWTPEVSSYRVGKISHYEPDSKKVTLMPVPEYPIEKKTEEDDDSSMEPDASLYKEDGSLEIEFSSLLDVRCIKTSSPEPAAVAKSAPPKPDQASTKLKPSTSNGLQTPAKENGKADPWEELSEALSAKKAALSEANNGWNKKASSSAGSWSYKALRGSAMGPVMNYLRSQKEI